MDKSTFEMEIDDGYIFTIRPSHLHINQLKAPVMLQIMEVENTYIASKILQWRRK